MTKVHFQQKLLGLLGKLALIPAMILLSLPSFGQGAWDSTFVAGKFVEFDCTLRTSTNRLYITNTTRADPSVARIWYDNATSRYSFVCPTSHDDFLDAFRNAFSEEKIAQLAERHEFVRMNMFVDGRGKIIFISFSLEAGTIILPEELELLEMEFLRRVKFKIVGVKVNAPICHYVDFDIPFEEVVQGKLGNVAWFIENFKKAY